MDTCDLVDFEVGFGQTIRRWCFGSAGAGELRLCALAASYSCSALKVSQACRSPDANPCRNQRTRCAELPWVKASGTT